MTSNRGCRFALLICYLIFSCSGSWKVYGEIEVDSEVTALPGNRVHLPCASASNQAVSWKYYSETPSGDGGRIVSHNGVVYDTFQPRFTQMVNGTLLISNVQLTDAGYYECLGRNGLQSLNLVLLHVLEAVPRTPPAARSSLLSYVSNQEEILSASTPSTSSAVNHTIIITVAVVLSIVVVIAVLLALAVVIRSKARRRKSLTTLEIVHSLLQRRRDDPYCITVCNAGVSKLVAAAISDKHILLLSQDNNKIRVFSNLEEYNELQAIDIAGTILQDIVFCEETGAFYVADKRPAEEIGFVWRISKNFEVMKWLPLGEPSARHINPNSMSVRSDRLLIISAYKDLLLYDASDGHELNQLRPPGVRITHAAETPNGRFVVCFWEPKNQIVLLNAAGHSVRTFSGGQQALNLPYYLVACDDGRIIVADSGNNRIIVLDTELRFLRELKRNDDADLRYPWQFSVEEHSRKIVVVCRDQGVFLFENVYLD